MRSIRVFAKNMGDPYYEPTIVVYDKKMADHAENQLLILRHFVPTVVTVVI